MQEAAPHLVILVFGVLRVGDTAHNVIKKISGFLHLLLQFVALPHFWAAAPMEQMN